MQKPPSNLKPLTDLHENKWVGTTVYHPMTQMGPTPYWREIDVPKKWRDPPEDGVDQTIYVYDVGVVLSHDRGQVKFQC